MAQAPRLPFLPFHHHTTRLVAAALRAFVSNPAVCAEEKQIAAAFYNFLRTGDDVQELLPRLGGECYVVVDAAINHLIIRPSSSKYPVVTPCDVLILMAMRQIMEFKLVWPAYQFA